MLALRVWGEEVITEEKKREGIALKRCERAAPSPVSLPTKRSGSARQGVEKDEEVHNHNHSHKLGQEKVQTRVHSIIDIIPAGVS